MLADQSVQRVAGVGANKDHTCIHTHPLQSTLITFGPEHMSRTFHLRKRRVFGVQRTQKNPTRELEKKTETVAGHLEPQNAKEKRIREPK